MEWTTDDWKGCRHRKYHHAQRTYGENIPYYAQGAVFPGDEAGHRCELSGELCESRPGAGECPLEDEQCT